jgi:hypothetical protein
MDTRTLVIGQKVSMTKSGIYGEWGEVVEVKLGHSFVKYKKARCRRYGEPSGAFSDRCVCHISYR